MNGLVPWAGTNGLNLAKDSLVCCTIGLPNYPDELIGIIQLSQIVQTEPEAVWNYDVLFPPARRKRLKWTLVTGINPSQLMPVSAYAPLQNQIPVPDASVKSTARVVNFDYQGPQASFTESAFRSLLRPIVLLGGAAVGTGAATREVICAIGVLALLVQIVHASFRFCSRKKSRPLQE